MNRTDLVTVSSSHTPLDSCNLLLPANKLLGGPEEDARKETNQALRINRGILHTHWPVCSFDLAHEPIVPPLVRPSDSF